jgi:hypothetical protein
VDKPPFSHTDWISPAHYRKSHGWTVPSLTDGARIFPQFIRPTDLSMWCVVFSQAALDYVVSSRADGVARLPERVVVLLAWYL